MRRLAFQVDLCCLCGGYVCLHPLSHLLSLLLHRFIVTTREKGNVLLILGEELQGRGEGAMSKEAQPKPDAETHELASEPKQVYEANKDGTLEQL